MKAGGGGRLMSDDYVYLTPKLEKLIVWLFLKYGIHL